MNHTFTLGFYGDCIMLTVALLNVRAPFSLDTDGETFVIKVGEVGKAVIDSHQKYVVHMACWS